MLSPKTSPSKELRTLVYDPIKHAWASPELSSEEISIDLLENITFLTYNVWHDKESFEERSKELLKIIEETSADFICLQEVTKPFYTKLLACKWVRDEYYIPEISADKCNTLILSRFPCKFHKKEWPTRMERYLLYGEIQINKVRTAVATLHLESLANSSYRKKQLDITFEELGAYPKVFILGDFNFDWASENKNIAPHYIDIWPILHPGSPGCTQPKTHDFIAWRPDKILMKKHKKYRPMEVRRVGMEPLPKYQLEEMMMEREPDEYEIRTPSDHFGLKFIVEMLDNDPQEEWISSGQKTRERVHKERKTSHYVWIDGTKRAQETYFYLEQLKKALAVQKGEMKTFEKIDEGMDSITSRLEEYHDLTIVVSLYALHEMLHNWKKELKVIQDKFMHEKHFRFKVLVFTARRNYEDAMQLCQKAGFEKYFVCTKFHEVMDSLSTENSVAPMQG